MQSLGSEGNPEHGIKVLKESDHNGVVEVTDSIPLGPLFQPLGNPGVAHTVTHGRVAIAVNPVAVTSVRLYANPVTALRQSDHPIPTAGYTADDSFH